MKNNFLTTQQIARMALPILRDNLVFPMLSHIEYSDDFARCGDTVQIKKPPVYTACEFTGKIEPQKINETSALVKLDKIADVSVEIGSREMALNISDFEHQVLMPAMVAIAEKINSDGMSLYKEIPFSVGKPGVTPDSIDTISDAARLLNKNKAPISDRHAVWDYEALAKLQLIPAIINAEKSGDTKSLREGCIGRILGMENYMSQAIKTHTPIITGEKSVNNPYKLGDDIISITIKADENVCKGDIFVFDNVNYTVIEDGVINGTNCEFNIYPPLCKDIKTTDKLLFIDKHTVNLAFHKNAFAFVTRPLEAAKGAESYVTSFEGITIRVTMDYDIATKSQILSIDTLYGFKTLYPELATRVMG